MEITKGAIGPEASYDLKLTEDGVVFVVEYKGADASAKLEASIGVDQFIEKLKVMIPGKIDDMLLDALKAALK